VVNNSRDRPVGTLRLNVPSSAARLVLPAIVPSFLAAYPEIRLEVIAEESFVDVLAADCDAGIRYEEKLEQDMIAVPIGPASSVSQPLPRRAISIGAGGPTNRGSFSSTRVCAADLAAVRCHHGSSSVTVSWFGSMRRGRCS
jgi:DNA-binding transcriptional LysR family regulator